MRGQVDTPTELVDHMVDALFAGCRPARDDRLLDSGCGTGAFISGVLRWCERNNNEVPRITGIDSDPERIRVARDRFSGLDAVTLVNADYLETRDLGSYRFIIGNPPYVGLPRLPAEERELYRENFETAVGRFDLYFLFFERALSELSRGGRLVFVTPEKWLYVKSAHALRLMLTRTNLELIELLPDSSFPHRATYPCITVVKNAKPQGSLICRPRGAPEISVDQRKLGADPWWSLVRGDDQSTPIGTPVLANICRRISAGVATGADRIFVRSKDDLPKGLRPFAVPTIAGRDLSTDGAEDSVTNRPDVMLVPYAADGTLQPLNRLGSLANYLRRKDNRAVLEARTCAARKPWYAFHDSLPLDDLRQPKLLCKDITSNPMFWIDRDGDIIPRHSVYYIVPARSRDLDALAEWLNSESVRGRLRMRCQRAQNGSLRLQAEALRSLSLHDAPAALLDTAAVA